MESHAIRVIEREEKPRDLAAARISCEPVRNQRNRRRRDNWHKAA